MNYEIWRDVPGYEGLYQVSQLGRIRSLPKYNHKTIRILSQQRNKRDGRMSLYLCKSPTDRRRVSVHRLVALAFVPNPHGYAEVNHKDENPQNNRAENLEWCTRKYNMNYKTTPLRLNLKNKKPVEARDENGNKILFNSVRCAKLAGYDGSGILMSIKTGKRYKALYWRYANGY